MMSGKMIEQNYLAGNHLVLKNDGENSKIYIA